MGASEPRSPPPVAIVGAGSIGVGWAIVFARAGYAVRIHDPDGQRLAVAPDEIASRLEALASFDQLPDDAAVVLGRIAVLEELGPTVDGCVYVQECAPEDVDLKRELFARLDAAAPAEAVLASSSSTLPASRFAGDVAGRARCLVAHPGNPPYLLPVVELVTAPFTSEEAVDRATETLESAGMSVVRVNTELEGFVFNRLQGALLREAYCLVRDGVADVDDVDRVVREGLGRRWAVVGPFETADLNTRGGIEAHAHRMGPAYARMGSERGQNDPWTTDLVQRVTSERRRLLPLEAWEDRVVWRDRMLMQLERARQEPERSAREEADRRAIASVLTGYCRMLDSLELEQVPSYFTDDCEVIYGPEPRMQSRGAARLAESLGRLSRFARTSHHLSNVEIELTGPDSATSVSYVLAWHQQPDGASRTVYAQYHDRFVRTAGGWRIAERRQLTNGTDVPWDLALTQAPRRDARRPMLIRPDDVQETAEPDNAVVMRALLPASASDGDLSVTWVEISGRHRRLKTRRSTRAYYVLAGGARFAVGGGETFEARAGDVVVVPRNTPYELEGEMTYLVINGPGYVAGDDEFV